MGVMLDRDSRVYAARQGVLKSARAFASINPDYPDDRIRYIFPFLFELEESIDSDRMKAAVSEVVSAYAYLLSQIGVNDKRVMSK